MKVRKILITNEQLRGRREPLIIDYDYGGWKYRPEYEEDEDDWRIYHRVTAPNGQKFRFPKSHRETINSSDFIRFVNFMEELNIGIK